MKKVPLLFLGLLLFCVLNHYTTYAALIIVPVQQPDIQSGIDAANSGDTVVVLNGTYQGSGNRSMSFQGKAITVRSFNNAPNLCVIDCEDSGRAFLFENGEDSSSILQGFKIVNGNAYNGGGIYFGSGTSPAINNCWFMNCVATNNGGAIHCEQSSPSFINSTFSGNRSQYGGGINLNNYSTPSFTQCIISSNTAELDGGGNSSRHSFRSYFG